MGLGLEAASALEEQPRAEFRGLTPVQFDEAAFVRELERTERRKRTAAAAKAKAMQKKKPWRY